MNAVEIEEAVSQLAEAPFDPEEFPFAFLEAFGNKATTIKKLRSTKGSSNHSDLGGVLQRNNIHLKVCPPGQVADTLTALRESPATSKHKAKFILATDGHELQAENLADGETVACDYPDFADHFGFFLPLAGITTVKQIRENAFDIKATARLNRLYTELLKTNPDWDTAERREEMNHFMARLIFCFFAEDTNIFHSDGLFTRTVAQMSASDSSNTHEVLAEIFRAMATPLPQRESAAIRNWANGFPYVNGGLFGPHPLTPSPILGEGGQDAAVSPLSRPGRGAGGEGVPRFSKIARSYLLHVGNLDWTKINPDIFGSMIQAVADEEERGALGMHYTSVPNILKVLNPLFLDDLREQLAAADDNPRKLLNLRKRMAKIRVFDPACGSGNFLVIAYKEMRAIEAEINRRRGEPDLKTEIPLTNFRGIEIRHFSCEIARLALIIAEYQCDVLYRGQRLALAEFLPLKADNWITCGNALRLDWLSICPPTGTGVKVRYEGLDLWGETYDQVEMDFENEGGETYICGNPPYQGYNKQNSNQKEDLEFTFKGRIKTWGNLDYVAAWFLKSADFLRFIDGKVAFVSTNSICQGGQVPILWPLLKNLGARIEFAYTSFKWSNLASNNAGITVIIVGLSKEASGNSKIIETSENNNLSIREAMNINGYLIPAIDVYIRKQPDPISNLSRMSFGNHLYYGSALLLDWATARNFSMQTPGSKKFIRPIYGSTEIINRRPRACLWIEDSEVEEAMSISWIKERLMLVKEERTKKTNDLTAQALKDFPHRFRDRLSAQNHFIAVPQTTSENREYLPCDLKDKEAIVTFKCYAIYDAPLWNLAILASKIHLVWIATVCGRMRTDFSYSNTLGWNTFPVPTLTTQNKTDLTRCAEEILLAREHYFPATIADMYDPDRMDSEFPLVRAAHERNDETLERIYIGRRFKNDTERLEKLFELYTKMTSQQTSSKKPAQRKPKSARHDH
ncbi:class I SAM-dependent DNA methyltransferase [Phormidium sp. FACHB-1136]|nr:class I SAM-dependent DNA methyltransferase [Phormidium sp. FACHB-1136]